MCLLMWKDLKKWTHPEKYLSDILKCSKSIYRYMYIFLIDNIENPPFAKSILPKIIPNIKTHSVLWSIEKIFGMYRSILVTTGSTRPKRSVAPANILRPAHCVYSTYVLVCGRAAVVFELSSNEKCSRLFFRLKAVIYRTVQLQRRLTWVLRVHTNNVLRGMMYDIHIYICQKAERSLILLSYKKISFHFKSPLFYGSRISRFSPLRR